MKPRVWAPFAARVDLLAGNSRQAMRAGKRGWWASDLDLEPGTDYQFSLDGEPGLPDPRSRHQPGGVHGPSRVVAARNSPPGAESGGIDMRNAVVYELHIGTFTPEGTFAAARGRLDHLVDLGIDVVEIMPVNAYAGHHGWGYDGVALYAVHEAYGGPDGLGEFVDACHRRGLKVVLDVVYNHLGPDGNHLGRFGPYFTDRYRTAWGDAVNLDGPDSDLVRRFLIENALMWLGDYDVDGLRIDAVHALFDRSALHFLEELARNVSRLETETGRRYTLIAESDLNDPRLVWPRDRGGYGLAASWSDDFHHSLHAVLTGERIGYYEDFGRLGDVTKALQDAYVYDGRFSPHRRRRHGRSPRGMAGYAFLGYLQNHDQVGNRARGDRISHIAGTQLQKVGAALVLTSPFVPMIFQGEEWAASAPFPYFTDHEAELGAAVRRGRRGEFAAFGWDPDQIPDPQDPATFAAAKLKWSETDQPGHADVLDWYRRLIALRRSTPDLTDGRLDRVRATADESGGILIVERGSMMVVANFFERTAGIEAAPGAELVMASAEVTDSGDQIELAPASVAIMRRGQEAIR